MWCELQTLKSAVLDLIRHLSPTPVWLSPHQLLVWGEERHRDISALLSFQSELYSPCVSLGVWLVISTACVSAGSSVLILSGWSRTKWTQRPEITVELVFFVEIDQGSYLASNLCFLDITDTFLIILFCILHLPVPFSCLCGLKCQFYKAEISPEWFLSHLNVPKGYVGKGYFDILELSVLFSFIILVLYLAKTLLIFPPKICKRKHHLTG